MAKGTEQTKDELIEVRAVVDRIEDGNVAVLSLADDQRSQLDVPLSQLPDGTSDGDHLLLTLSAAHAQGRTLKKAVLDKRSRADAAARITRLQEQLERQGGTQDKKDFKL